jgi:hypothetical protein
MGEAVLMASLTQELEEIIDFYGDRYSWALSRISELEADLAEARDTIHQIVEGDSVEWDLA